VDFPRSRGFQPSVVRPLFRHRESRHTQIFHPNLAGAEGRSEGRVIRGRFPSDMSDGFFLSSPSETLGTFSENAIDSFVIAPRGL
jgi:hypothetical protein